MCKVTTKQAVRAIVGEPPGLVLAKVTDTLDEGCRSVLAHAPLAALGYRGQDGVPHTSLIGGTPGFARVESPASLSFEVPAGEPRPVSGGGASMTFLLPGIGETLRLNGVVAGMAGDRVTVDVDEAWVHCARCVLRSRLWRGAEPQAGLARLPVSEFLSLSTFVVVSSWDDSGRGDTSPKGDPAGFVRPLDGNTLAIPDRKGNRRADTFHNLVTCDEVSLAALVPGSDDVLHLSGNAYVTDDPALLATMALQDTPPHAALVVHLGQAEIRPNEAVRASRMWDPSAHVDPAHGPDLVAVGVRHLARNKQRGARMLAKGLAATAKLGRRAVDAGYRKELRKEGYAED